MTPKLHNRTDLIHWLSDHAPHKRVQRALEHGEAIVWGLFKGGFVVEAKYKGKSYVIGIKPVGIDGHLICGMLSAVPFGSYVGGDTPLKQGDYAFEAEHLKHLAYKPYGTYIPLQKRSEHLDSTGSSQQKDTDNQPT